MRRTTYALALAALAGLAPGAARAQQGQGYVVYLQEPPVAAELKLTAAQKKAVKDRIAAARRDAAAAADALERTPEGQAAQKSRAEFFRAPGDTAPQPEMARLFRPVPLAEHLDRAAADLKKSVLTKKQWERLTQIHYQRRGWRALTDPAVVKALNLDEPAVAVIKELKRERSGAFRNKVDEFQRWNSSTPRGRGGPPPDPKAVLAALDAQADAADKALERQALRLLTKRQRAKWQAMLGPPFKPPPLPPLDPVKVIREIQAGQRAEAPGR